LWVLAFASGVRVTAAIKKDYGTQRSRQENPIGSFFGDSAFDNGAREILKPISPKGKHELGVLNFFLI
jgi:hypothetical protein